MTDDEIGTILYRLLAHRSTVEQRWRPVVVTGETRTSWIVDGLKVDKATLRFRDGGTRLYTAAERDDWEWARMVRPRLVSMIEGATLAQLRAYAAALGEDA